MSQPVLVLTGISLTVIRPLSSTEIRSLSTADRRCSFVRHPHLRRGYGYGVAMTGGATAGWCFSLCAPHACLVRLFACCSLPLEKEKTSCRHFIAPSNVAEYLQSKGVKILKGPLTHKEDRDRYLYFEDPDGNMIELVASTVNGWPGKYLR